jgi:hypothetical protein
MTALHRWALVALGLALAAGLVAAMRSLPAEDSDVGSTELVAQIRASSGAPYSGYVETEGTIQLPVSSRFTDIGELFGEQTKLRVWSRGPDQWRVDKLLATGETDLIHDDSGTTEWRYDGTKVTHSVDPDIRLPRSADLLPPVLARRVLEDVDPAELARLDPRRVAGRDALGLRLSPASEQSTIDHVDLWSDAATGIPLRLAVYGGASSSPSFVTEFREFSASAPTPADLAFTAPPGADVSFDEVLDIADAANQYADVTAPARLAGLARSSRSDGAVSVYGTGVTQLMAIPLWDRVAVPLREQLEITPGSRRTPAGVAVETGPLSVLLTEEGHGSGWLVSGTVTPATLATAAEELRASLAENPRSDQ